EANWWPLLQDCNCGEQLIAGKSLLELQQDNSREIENAHQYDNAWITRADWEKLAAAEKPAVLKSQQGFTLGWIGEASGKEIIASEESFLINYAWEFISLNEQIVSQLTASDFQGEVSPAAHIDGHVTVGKGSRLLPGVVRSS
ncbi:MAG: hypothetical protein PQJ35_06065, partial [Sphaerochaetaceae bacterium]|nr:hypothetical protein [Sphaerochaetaceae bacterium]